MSISTILIKIGVSGISSLQATFIRLIWASAALYSYGFLTKNIKKWITPFKEKELLKISLLALLIGIFGGFWMFTLSLKYIDASAAIILSSTTPIFILPIVAVLSKEKVSFRAILGAVITFTGIIFILLK